MSELQNIINAAWEDRSNVTTQTQGDVREAVDVALAKLDCGEFRIADKSTGQWVVNDWLKKAVCWTSKHTRWQPRHTRSQYFPK